MSVSAEALRRLHRIHRQLTDLRSRLDRGPKQIKASDANAERLQQAFDGAKEVHTKARVSADEKQLQLQEREARIEKLRTNLNTASSNKEYQAIKEQIAADEQANSVLSDEILEALERIDELEADVKAADEAQNKAVAELQKVRDRVNEEQPKLEQELTRVNDELKEAETVLPSDFKSNYDRISAARGEDALAPVDGESCGGCYQTLSPQTINELLMSKPVFCKSCGCLLYLPEDRSVGK